MGRGSVFYSSPAMVHGKASQIMRLGPLTIIMTSLETPKRAVFSRFQYARIRWSRITELEGAEGPVPAPRSLSSLWGRLLEGAAEACCVYSANEWIALREQVFAGLGRRNGNHGPGGLWLAAATGREICGLGPELGG